MPDFLNEKGSMTSKGEFFEQLRKQAEHLLDSKGISLNAAEVAETHKLLHELQVHQIELEMQNDELNLVALQLETERSRFLSLFEMAPVGYIVLNRKGNIVDINKAGSGLFGFRKELLLHKSMAGFVFADDVHRFNIFFKRINTENREKDCQVRMFRSGEPVFYAEINGICIEKANRENCYITISDISEKKNAELELEKAQRRLGAALTASSTGIWEIKLPSGEVYLDDFSKSIFGVRQYSFDGKYSSLTELIDHNDREKVDAALRISLVRGDDFAVEFSVHTYSGEDKYIDARGRLIYDEGGNRRLAGTVTDITKRKLMELETMRLKESQQQRIRAASLQAEENIRQNISASLHDSVGQMLYALKINIEQWKTNDVDTHYRQVNQLLDQAINEVRNLSFELAPSILKDFGLVATIEEMARRLSTNTLSVKVKSSQVNHLEMTIMSNIYRIVQELVNNCIKHAMASEIDIELYKKKSFIYIRVTDNGKGFKPGQASSKPTGSGLSSIRNRLNLYNGTMEVDSAAGKGTSVLIRLKQ